MPRKKRDYSPLPGFPREDKFQCMEEVDRYFSGNSIQCLQCGHHFSGLARHLTREHGMSAEEYKEEHGIPWKRGLVSALLHGNLSQIAKENDSLSHIGEFAAVLKGRKVKVRAYCPARVNAKRLYTVETYYSFADRVAAGEPILTISKEEGMPSVDAVRAFMGKNNGFRRYWNEFVEPNIIGLQKHARENLASGKVSVAFSMAKKGSTAKEIAQATGYSEANARLFIKGKTWLSIRKEA